MRRSIVLFGLSIGVAAAAACSSSSSNTTPTQDAGVPEAAAVVGDSGLSCGTASCASGEVCCFSRTSPTCTTVTDCQGSYLSCSSTASCSAGKVCCFSFTDDSGTGMGPFAAQCADSCTSPSYKLCATNSECAAGETCSMGTYTLYCGMMGGGFMFDASGLPRRDTGAPPVAEASTGDTGTTSETGTDQ